MEKVMAVFFIFLWFLPRVQCIFLQKWGGESSDLQHQVPRKNTLI